MNEEVSKGLGWRTLNFSADGRDYNINITELKIPDNKFRYLYYSYKLQYLEKFVSRKAD